MCSVNHSCVSEVETACYLRTWYRSFEFRFSTASDFFFFYHKERRSCAVQYAKPPYLFAKTSDNLITNYPLRSRNPLSRKLSQNVNNIAKCCLSRRSCHSTECRQRGSFEKKAGVADYKTCIYFVVYISSLVSFLRLVLFVSISHRHRLT